MTFNWLLNYGTRDLKRNLRFLEHSGIRLVEGTNSFNVDIRHF